MCLVGLKIQSRIFFKTKMSSLDAQWRPVFCCFSLKQMQEGNWTKKAPANQKNAKSIPFNPRILIPQKKWKMYEHKCLLFMKPLWNQMKSCFSQLCTKTNNISQNIQQGLNVLKTHNTTTSETWLEVSSNMIPRVSLYKSRTCLKMIQDTQQYPTQKCFALNVNMLNLVRFFFFRSMFG